MTLSKVQGFEVNYLFSMVQLNTSRHLQGGCNHQLGDLSSDLLYLFPKHNSIVRWKNLNKMDERKFEIVVKTEYHYHHYHYKKNTWLKHSI